MSLFIEIKNKSEEGPVWDSQLLFFKDFERGKET
jgi:hypothetical protein